MFLKFRQVGRRLEHEHAAVPVIITGIQVLFRSRQGRLLDEFLDRINIVTRFRVSHFLLRASPYIAVSCLRRRRHNPECQQSTLFNGAESVIDGLTERLCIFNHMVCRQHQQHMVFALFHCTQSRNCNRRGRVAANGFQDHCARRLAGLSQLLSDHETMSLVTNH